MKRRYVMHTFSGLEAGRGGEEYGFATKDLLNIEKYLPERMAATAETGCGKSTVLFSNLSDQHRVFARDDGGMGERSAVRFFKECPLTRLERVSLHLGPTQLILPSFKHDILYDAVLIDGPHGYPFPEMEYLSFYPHIRTGGLLLVDDVNIPTIGRMVDFIYEDEMFDFVALCSNTAIFRRTDAPTFDPLGDGWWTQRYNRRRVSRRRDIHLPGDPPTDFFTAQNLDQKMVGE